METMSYSNTVYFANMNSNSSSDQEDGIGDVCIPNISPQERKKRARFAVGQLIVALIILGVLVIINVNPLWRLLLFFMFSAATTSYIQVLDKT